MSYFVGLNYSLANEDTRVELDLLREGTDRVLCVAGSGARVLPLLSKNPKHLTVVDVSLEQLFLTELRIEAARELGRDEYLKFMGYQSAQLAEREAWLKRIKLSAEARDFWETNLNNWAESGLIWLGRWENHFLKLNRFLRPILGSRIDRIFDQTTLDDQKRAYEKYWRPALFRAFLKVAASEWVFNRFLYRGHFSGHEDRRTETRAPWKFFDEEFRRIFNSSLVRENYFFQMLFLGRLKYPEGYPLETRADILEAVRRSSTRIGYVREDLVSHTRSAFYDFHSLSDTFSYFAEQDAHGFLERFPSQTRSGSTVVLRSFLRSPGSLEFRGWEAQTSEEKNAQKLDFTGVYRFHIFRKL